MDSRAKIRFNFRTGYSILVVNLWATMNLINQIQLALQDRQLLNVKLLYLFDQIGILFNHLVHV